MEEEGGFGVGGAEGGRGRGQWAEDKRRKV